MDTKILSEAWVLIGFGVLTVLAIIALFITAGAPNGEKDKTEEGKEDKE